MMEYGKGEAFRRESWMERTAARLRRPLSNSPLRRPLRLAYEAILDRLPGDRLTCRCPGGERVRLAAEYRQVTWNAQECAAFAAAVRPGDVVLDIGANLGAYTMLFAQWVGARGHVYAFEPAPDARRGLARHVELNAVGDRVTLLGDAMSAAEGVARFHAMGPRGDNRLAAIDDDRSIEVRTTTIDAFCGRQGLRPGLIKIDVEGAELDVLRGARATIAAGLGRLAIFVEMHPHLWPDFGASRAAIEAELARQHLVAERLDGRGDLWAIEGVCLRVRRCES
jgi:FkbM family methyltransferase